MFSTNKKSQLIFISDLEGCATKFFNKNQSTQVCTKDFFDKIDNFLSKNDYNKVAFLGDYFDKGMDFKETIERIINLYEKHNNKILYEKHNNKIKKVHIILGNRDINKLRLFHELYIYNIKYKVHENNSFLQQLPKNNSIWNEWKNFLKNYFENILQVTEKKTLTKERFKIILENSMGAQQTPENYETLFKYFDNILDPKPGSKNKDPENFAKLFEYGLIAHYDPDYQVLLSHAGGIGSFQFHNQTYYDNIFEKFETKNDNIITYFKNIEIARKELMKKPIENQIYTNINSNKIIDILEIINGPLKKYISFQKLPEKKNNYNNNNLKKEAMNNFYLLQALGLKPDKVGIDPFVSFVQSCDCIMCKGPINNNIATTNGKAYNEGQYKIFLKTLETLNVKFVSFGHNPVCTPVPLIYRRPENENIVFIGNDVSNGYRNANITNIYKIPLAYIELSSKVKNEKSFSVGVGIFKEKKKSSILSLLSRNKNENMLSIVNNKNISSLPQSLQPYSPMIKKWQFDKVPLFNKNNKSIKYNNDKLIFPARKSKPFEPPIFLNNRE